MAAFDRLLLSAILLKDEYARKVFPFIKSEYFSDRHDRKIFDLIAAHVVKHSKFPTRESIIIDLADNATDISDEAFEECKSIVVGMDVDPKTDIDWLIDRTESFCKERAINNAVMKAIEIINDPKETPNGIPSLLSDALSVSFDSHVGHDFFSDYQARHDFYTRKEQKFRFDIEILNSITKGGISRKWLFVIAAGTNVGKSLALCHCAANNLIDGHNVLYITLEMAEEYIAQRIDANLLNVPIDELVAWDLPTYEARINALKRRILGRLVIKEYPTSSASVSDFRRLLEELRTKKNFIPDLIYVDYLTLCASSRTKFAGLNTYTYYKMVSEELRGLGCEYDVPIITAAQLNRSGAASSDPEMTETSDSFGIPYTADLMLVMTTNEELDAIHQVAFKQVKNRNNDKGLFRRFTVGIDRDRMRLLNVPQSGQQEANGTAERKFNKREFVGFT